MSVLDGLATAIQSELGTAYVLTDDAAAEYAIDGVAPGMVALPADESQVAAVMRLANEYQATVFPRGGGSHTGLGHPPARVDMVLGLQRLQQQLAYEPADMTTTVQAGLRLAELQQRLESQQQFLALDPPAAATTTVGGMVAANTSGPRRLLYGTARDLVLGMAVIGADGKRTKAGARVVKNVTGYDLNKLYIGSLGTLAVVVELTFKIHPLPIGEQTFGIGFSHQADILQLLQTLLHLHLRLNSLELLDPAAAAWLAQQADLQASEAEHLLIVRVEGTSEVTRQQIQRIREALPPLPMAGSLTVHAWNEAEQQRLWPVVQEFTPQMYAAAPQGAVVKVSLRLSELPMFFQKMREAAARAGTTWPMLGHAGNGIVYINLRPPPQSAAEATEMQRHVATLDACVARLQGRRVIERAPAELKRLCQVWGEPGDDFALMRAIKTSFDPQNRLNPGRFIGGI